jgi:cytochrome c oxidase subunit IV
MIVYINLAVGLFMIAIGIYIQSSGNYNLIAGYNSMSEEEKENFDIKRYAVFFRNVLIIMGILVIGIHPFLNIYGLEKYSLIITFLIIITGIIILNLMGGSFKK